MKIVLTGSTGLVGQNLLRLKLRRGDPSHREKQRHGPALLSRRIVRLRLLLFFANGLLAWPICLLQLLWRRSADSGRSQENPLASASLWTIMTAGVFIFCLYHYTKSAHHPSLFNCLRDPSGFLAYIAAAL